MIPRLFRWRLASLILMLFPLALAAATNSAWFARAWQTEDGLPEHTIVGLEQTPDGYLWIATHRSLSRFDGVRFQEFTPATPVGPTTDQIRAMLLDRRGRLWLARDDETVVCVEDGTIKTVVALNETMAGSQPGRWRRTGKGASGSATAREPCLKFKMTNRRPLEPPTD